jgi:hypothetical protein
LLHRRGQKATSLANRGGIPIAGQLEIILTCWRIGAPISYTASLYANTQRLIPTIFDGRSCPFRGVGANLRTKVLRNRQRKRLVVLACSVYSVPCCPEPRIRKALVLRFRPSSSPTHPSLNRRQLDAFAKPDVMLAFTPDGG